MKRVFLFAITAAAALMAASCQKEEMRRILTATIEQYEHNAKDGNASKAYINDQYYACWENNDMVKINGNEYPISISEGNDHNYSATIQGDVPTGQNLLAYYPASQVSNLTAAGGIVTLPPVQTYRENNGHQVIDNPMAAYCPQDSNELKFRNLGALLKVTIQGNTRVKTIQVKGDDNQMLWGEAPLKLNNQNIPMLGEFSKGSNSVVLNFPSAVSVNGSKSFYIVVPSNSSFNNLTIAVLTTDCSTYTHHCKTSPMGQGLLRNQIGAVSYTPNNCEDDTFLPSWMIRYTATARVTPYNAYAFGATVVDNTFDASNGTLLFDGPVTEIGGQAFYECHSLTGISLSASLTTIGEKAFKYCRSLTGISLPESLTSIGDEAFYYCSSLTGISLPESLTSIGNNAFVNCDGLISISLPAGVTSIGTGAFSVCSNLTSITLPESLTSIGDEAFDECRSLATISLPAGVTSIGMWAFHECYSLARVDCYAINPPALGYEAFEPIHSSAVLHVPSGSMDAYSNSSWEHDYFGGCIIDDLPAK